MRRAHGQVDRDGDLPAVRRESCENPGVVLAQSRASDTALDSRAPK
jgi:hypothetical protein